MPDASAPRRTRSADPQPTNAPKSLLTSAAPDVVTGAAGFVGSHLVRRLLAQGRTVVGVDDFDDYYDRTSKEGNLSSVRSNPRFRLLQQDLAEGDLSSLLTKGCRVYHLAAQPGVRGSWGAQFDRYVRNNILVTQRLLEAAIRTPPARIVNASSSSIYGELPAGPTPESATPNPVSPYGITKLAAEHLTRVYARAHRLSVVNLRFFTVYGPGQRPDMAFHRFIGAIQAHRPITLFGDGQQTRDFTFVDDIVDGILLAGEIEGVDGTFNLGGGSPAPLTEVIRILEEVSGRPVEIQPGDAPPGDPRGTWADTRRAREILGFRPKVLLAEGLRRQWAWQTGGLPPAST